MGWVELHLTESEARVVRKALKAYAASPTGDHPYNGPEDWQAPVVEWRDKETARDLDERLMRAKRVEAVL